MRTSSLPSTTFVMSSSPSRSTTKKRAGEPSVKRVSPSASSLAVPAADSQPYCSSVSPEKSGCARRSSISRGESVIRRPLTRDGAERAGSGSHRASSAGNRSTRRAVLRQVRRRGPGDLTRSLPPR
ncbi:hypothetical protein [Planomonospora algeriensis]